MMFSVFSIGCYVLVWCYSNGFCCITIINLYICGTSNIIILPPEIVFHRVHPSPNLICGGEAQNSPFTLGIEFGINRNSCFAFGAPLFCSTSKCLKCTSESPRSRFTNRFTTKRTTTHLTICNEHGMFES